MDIKPFTDNMAFMAGAPALHIAVSSISIIAFAALIFSFFAIRGMRKNSMKTETQPKAKKDYKSLTTVEKLATVFLGVGCVGLFVAAVVGMGTAFINHQHSYVEQQVRLQQAVKAEGFTVMKGYINLGPNTQSSLTLKYQEELMDCTLFSPVDVTANVFIHMRRRKLITQQNQRNHN